MAKMGFYYTMKDKRSQNLQNLAKIITIITQHYSPGPKLCSRSWLLLHYAWLPLYSDDVVACSLWWLVIKYDWGLWLNGINPGRWCPLNLHKRAYEKYGVVSNTRYREQTHTLCQQLYTQSSFMGWVKMMWLVLLFIWICQESSKWQQSIDLVKVANFQ